MEMENLLVRLQKAFSLIANKFEVGSKMRKAFSRSTVGPRLSVMRKKHTHLWRRNIRKNSWNYLRKRPVKKDGGLLSVDVKF